MATYLIIDINVTNREKFVQYAEAVQKTVKTYGGTYLCKWGAPESLEGDWDINKVVIIKFDTPEQAKDWWSSEEYRPLKSLRRSASTTRVLLVNE